MKLHDLDKLIISPLADTGLRRSDLANINVADLDVVSQTIYVWGKSAKERVVRYASSGIITLSQLMETPKGPEDKATEHDEIDASSGIKVLRPIRP